MHGQVKRECIIALTGLQAAPLIENAVKGTGVRVYVLDVPVIGVLDTNRLARILAREGKLLSIIRGCEKSTLIVPGTVEGGLEPVKDVFKDVNVHIVKGPKHPGELAAFVASLRLKKGVSAERVATIDFAGKRIAFRGPPISIVAEVHPEAVNPVALASRFLQSGVDFLMAGADPGWSMEYYVERMKSIQNIVAGRGRGLVFEAPTCKHIEALEKHGLLDDVATTLPPRFWDCRVLPRYGWIHPEPGMTGVDDRMAYLSKAVYEARDRGLTVVADPVLGLPLLGIVESLDRYRRALRELRVPLAMSAANVYEELPVDSYGVILLLSVIAIELGVSLFHVTEASWKSNWASAEASYAVRLVEDAWRLKTTPVNVDKSMCLVKRLGEVEPVNVSPGQRVRVEDVAPRLDKNLYFRIWVDWELGELVVGVYRVGGGLVKAYAGKNGLTILRSIAREYRGEVSGEHLGYLGFELAKAEEALRAGGGYVQDEPLLDPPWCREGGCRV